MFVDRGIDPERIAKSEPTSIEDFRRVAMSVLSKYEEIEESERFPLLIVLDSLSALPSMKEITDSETGSDKRDFTKAGLIKGTFRVLRLKMARLQVPMIITNHVYAVIGAYVPTKELAGGSGTKYAADTIVALSKKKEKGAGKEHIGNVIHLNVMKSRISREGTKVDTRILYDGGLDRYYGLLELAEEAGLVKKVATRYQFPSGEKAFIKAVLSDPEKYFTEDFLQQLDEYVITDEIGVEMGMQAPGIGAHRGKRPILTIEGSLQDCCHGRECHHVHPCAPARFSRADSTCS